MTSTRLGRLSAQFLQLMLPAALAVTIPWLFRSPASIVLAYWILIALAVGLNIIGWIWARVAPIRIGIGLAAFLCSVIALLTIFGMIWYGDVARSIASKCDTSLKGDELDRSPLQLVAPYEPFTSEEADCLTTQYLCQWKHFAAIVTDRARYKGGYRVSGDTEGVQLIMYFDPAYNGRVSTQGPGSSIYAYCMIRALSRNKIELANCEIPARPTATPTVTPTFTATPTPTPTLKMTPTSTPSVILRRNKR